MIKLRSAHIEEVRGIRKLDLNFDSKTFAISGPNGSGKSGVIDAIEFGLTGRIGRLTGKGTKGLSVAEHGPHVDKAKFPDASFVTLKVLLVALGKTATITRKLNAPNKPEITPADDDVRAVLAELADHPEITLSRREILRFILTDPTTRSQDIQTILKLDDVGQLRSALNTAQNKLSGAHSTLTAAVDSARSLLKQHLQIDTFTSAELLDAVNKRRTLLGLTAIAELTAATELDAGLSTTGKAAGLNKESALGDLEALTKAAQAFPELAQAEVSSILANVAKLDEDPALTQAVKQRPFIEQGFGFIDGPECPLCDTKWADEHTLRAHLKAKLAKSEEAGKLLESLVADGAALIKIAIHVGGLVATVQKIAETQADLPLSQDLTDWKTDLDALKTKLTTADGIIGSVDRLKSQWLGAPPTVSAALEALTATLKHLPDQSSTVAAQTFLSTAQLRLKDYRTVMRKAAAAKEAWSAAKATYEMYCSVQGTELNSLYEEVQKDFSAFYRAINGDDEAGFTAKLTPSEGSLGLQVNFYERGLFPPAAYHSEGHQDGMGVCLYLALMKRLFGPQFTCALLDDVVMSVDVGHRYQFCQLLKSQFPDAQFIITTHDRLWAEQMRSAGLVTAKTSVTFHSWTIDTGPIVESSVGIWEDIAGALAKGNVAAAAAALRNHLEYASRHLAEHLGATVQFHADGNFELGELLPSVLKRAKDLYGKAADAAQSWGDTAAKQAAATGKTDLAASNGAASVEQWAVNKAVHYNEWANFGKKDFEPVVAAFKDLLSRFTCAKCSSWLYVSPKGNPDSLRCPCAAINLNLKAKPK